MGRTFLSVSLGHGIRVGRSISDSDLRRRLPSWRKYELIHGLMRAAAARGEKMDRAEATYLVEKATDTGEIDAEGSLNFNMRLPREECIAGMLATAAAWGMELTRAQAEEMVDRAGRRDWRTVLIIGAAIIFALAMLLR
jgi:hypothetical protein